MQITVSWDSFKASLFKALLTSNLSSDDLNIATKKNATRAT